MDIPMSGAERRKMILNLIRNSDWPLSGGALGKETGVSRQVVVQDIALLRTEGHAIVATARGYILDEPKDVYRIIKTCHTNEQTEDELQTIVDLGGCVVDVMVNHKVYGKMTAPLNISSRHHIAQFLEGVRTGKSSELMNVTGGYHYHTVRAETEEILDKIEKTLNSMNYIVPEI